MIQAKGHDYSRGDAARRARRDGPRVFRAAPSRRSISRPTTITAFTCRVTASCIPRGMCRAAVQREHHDRGAVPGLFARNERIVCVFDDGELCFAVILVGALFVGSMETVWHGEVTPKIRRKPQPLPVSAGLRPAEGRGDGPIQHGLDGHAAVPARSPSSGAASCRPERRCASARIWRGCCDGLAAHRHARDARTPRRAARRDATILRRAQGPRSRHADHGERAGDGRSHPLRRSAPAPARRRPPVPAHLARVRDEAPARGGLRRHLPDLPRRARRRARPPAQRGVHADRVVSARLLDAPAHGRSRGAGRPRCWAPAPDRSASPIATPSCASCRWIPSPRRQEMLAQAARSASSAAPRATSCWIC